ncbi:hypothetical protein Dimus_035953 [Dionaea muscipula]
MDKKRKPENPEEHDPPTDSPFKNLPAKGRPDQQAPVSVEMINYPRFSCKKPPNTWITETATGNLEQTRAVQPQSPHGPHSSGESKNLTIGGDYNNYNFFREKKKEKSA